MLPNFELSAICGYTDPAGRVNSPSQVKSGCGFLKNAGGAFEPHPLAASVATMSKLM